MQKRISGVNAMELLKRAAFPVAVAVLGAFAGLWIFLYSQELRDALSQLGTKGGLRQAMTAHVVIAFLLFIAFLVVFALQQYTLKMADKAAQHELMSESTTLRTMIADLKTLPPEGFLQSFQESFSSVAELMLFTRPVDGKTTDYADMIRSVLRSTAALARGYDRDPEGVEYTATVMVYWSGESLQKHFDTPRSKTLLSTLKFSSAVDHHFSSDDGILELVPALAASANAAQPPTLAPLALPVSKNPRTRVMGGDKFNVLPGGPFAVAFGKYAHYESIEAMLKWCRDEADILQSVQEQLRVYYSNGDGKHIGSFLSVPLTLNGMHIGVVNIQASAPRMLSHGGTARFVPVLTPLVTLLSYLVSNWVIQRDQIALALPRPVAMQR